MPRQPKNPSKPTQFRISTRRVERRFTSPPSPADASDNDDRADLIDGGDGDGDGGGNEDDESDDESDEESENASSEESSEEEEGDGERDKDEESDGDAISINSGTP